MTAAAATTSRTPRTPWGSRSSTTPHAHPARTPSSLAQNSAPPLTPQARSPSSKQAQTSSPSYFGLAVDAETDNPVNSDAGGYARKNWRTPSSAVRSQAAAAAASPKPLPHEANPGLAAFRKQSESNTFQLDGGNFGAVKSPTRPSSSRTNSRDSGYMSPRSQENNGNRRLDDASADAMDIDENPGSIKSTNEAAFSSNTLLLDLPRRESPASLPTLSNISQGQLSRVDERHSRLSLPQNRVEQTNNGEGASKSARASTLPSPLSSSSGGPSMITPNTLLDLLKSIGQNKILILDVRVSPQYAQSRVSGALNLCIPTTLLKRPSFNTQKLKETFTLEEEKERFSRWQDLPIIVLYDANSHQLKDATSAVNTMKKFTNEGWQGKSYIIRGGYQDILKKCPEMIEKPGAEHDQGNPAQLSIDSRAAGSLQVAGGLAMPSTKTAANPFFGNIRQNMDLIGGVGQMPIKHPDALTYKSFKVLPKWLQRAADEGNKGNAVSEQFLALEKEEQQRMKAALSADVHYGNAAVTPSTSKTIQVAGIEKGTKNRYNNILPFNHTRVKLQNVPVSECDYINASHIKAEWSNRRYIAAQAPVPATFGDFWRVVWEQDARVIVMLSAESEGGQRKCHPYWVPDDYGPMKLKALSEKKVFLGPTTPAASSSSSSSSNNLAPDNFRSPLLTPQPERLLANRRRATNPFGATAQEAARDQSASLDAEAPHVIVRHLTLSHSSHPFEPMREITQLQYSNWPDFGAPAHPTDLLGLVAHCNAVIRSSNNSSSADAFQPAKPDERPIVVHCSAGCGRTGTFCTVDSVIDMLKRQRAASRATAAQVKEGDEMDIDTPAEDWVHDDEKDLIAKTVQDFRLQRLSMVQTLRQYVLCYETILEWLIKEMPEKYRRDAMRKSYGG